MGNKWFGTDGMRGKANVFPMSIDFAVKLGQAAAGLICKQHKKVAIGKDTRVSGDMLEQALAAGFLSQGVDVIKLGVLPTPAISTVTPLLDVDMSVMITASHNPYQDNGIKLLTADGDKFTDEVTVELEAMIEAGEFHSNPDQIGKIFINETAIEKYKEIALNMVAEDKPLKNLKVVLDCANGCFSQILPEVFRQLGAETIVLADQPDGCNINRDCGSMHPQKMMQKVLEVQADLGIAVDGDGDRIIVCDDRGNRINSEQIIGFLAQYLHQCGELKGRAVVSTVLSNTGLETFIKKMGIGYYSTPVGERHVVAKMKETNGAVGGEESGHVVVADYCKTGDAMMTGIVLCRGLKASGKKMSELFPIFAMEPMFFKNPRFESKEQVKQVVTDASFQALLEECRQEMGDNGRVVIHPSGTEPLIRVWVCGKDEALVNHLGEKLLSKAESLK